MTTFLLAHLNSAGSGIAQCEITCDATTEMSAEENARRQFAMLYPERQISIMGTKEGHAKK
jgi:hypothetical protein